MINEISRVVETRGRGVAERRNMRDMRCVDFRSCMQPQAVLSGSSGNAVVTITY